MSVHSSVVLWHLRNVGRAPRDVCLSPVNYWFFEGDEYHQANAHDVGWHHPKTMKKSTTWLSSTFPPFAGWFKRSGTGCGGAAQLRHCPIRST